MSELGILGRVGARPDRGTEADEARGRRLTRLTKRSLDLTVAAILLMTLWPLWVLIAFMIRRQDGGPVLYRQQRIGLRGQPFELLKFRSMKIDSDDAPLRALVESALRGQAGATNGSFKLHADPRVTPVGRWLRATSIDELPQLLNVMRGDMSLVGPRPALAWEMERFPPRYRRRTDVLPGMTGLWQVCGRSRVDTLDMLEYDLQYVDKASFWLDLRILLRTIPTLVRGDGAR
jgi:lipopolysaccharide/colanic/teichoic acid biosynthesis glycosyltransferase